VSAVLDRLARLLTAPRALLRRYGRRRPRAKRSLIVLFVALLVIPTWQRRLLSPESVHTDAFATFASTGVHSEPKFFFFLRHLGLYPLMTGAPIREDTTEEARRQLRENGDALRVDEGVTFRSGDRGRVYLYWVDQLVHDDALTPSLAWPNALGFWVALCALFTGFWWIRRPALGAMAVLFLGSDPFQLYSSYRQENVFGWSITVALVLMAAHLPLMTSRPTRSRWLYALPVLAGLLLASARTVRSEGTLIAASALFVYLTLARASWKRRLALAATLVGSMSLGTLGYARFFQHKFDESHAAMVAAGGTPYTGPLPIYHEVWHAVFCGLGDYDRKYGYVWDDRVAYAYAYPILTGTYHLELPPWKPDWYTFDATYDGTGKYPIFFSETAHYHDIIRDKVVGDITRDPLWYADILAKRTMRILAQTPPIALNAGGGAPLFSTTSAIGLVCVPLVALLALMRRWTLLKILLFTAPLSAPALIIYSARGMTNYSTFHYFGAAILLALGARTLRVLVARAGTA
jgi:hypothetical protein